MRKGKPFKGDHHRKKKSKGKNSKRIFSPNDSGVKNDSGVAKVSRWPAKTSTRAFRAASDSIRNVIVGFVSRLEYG
jgi:hypothetical protein